jgi:uncharacterized damage-inducible protein DinB
MKKLILPYASYNLWANGVLIDTIKGLTEEQYRQEVPSSFPGLFATLQHMWDAESIWWQRIKLMEQVRRPSEDFSGTFTDMTDSLMQQSKQWHEWVLNAQEHMLNHEFIYYNSRKEKFKQPVYQVLLHLFNHSTYHRGQLVTMLRQLEVTRIPPTDFIVWSRKSQAQTVR